MVTLHSVCKRQFGKRYQKEVVKLTRYNFEKDVDDDGDDNKTNCNAQTLLTTT